MKTGQFGVVRTKGFVPAVIRLMTRSQVNHAYIYVNETHVVEAEGQGAIVSKASKYDGSLHPESEIPLTNGERTRIAAEAAKLVGTPYNFLDIAALFFLLLGFRWSWLTERAQSQKALICSQLVDRAYRNADVHLFNDGRQDGQVTPGDLLVLLANNGPILIEGDEETMFG